MSEEAPESQEGQASSSPPAAVQPRPSGTNDGEPRASGHVHAHHSSIQFRFFEQLKHRNVIRVGILYLVVSWLILDPVHVLFHMLDVPVWANRLVVILMAVGFPAVLLFAWVYEITPEGLKPTVEVPHGQSIRKLTGRRLDRAIIAVLAVALAYFVVDKFWISKRVAQEKPLATTSLGSAPSVLVQPTISQKSVAVLPFLDMSEKKDQEYFSDGLSEELIDMLTKIPELRVPARTSSFYFKGKEATVSDIAKALGVAHLLEGSLRKSGDTLRITAQLIHADNGYHIWSETYERKLDDIFKVQDSIAAAVVQALKVSLIGGTVHNTVGTRNVEAYTLYLRGREIDNREVSKEELEIAADYLRKAVALDPAFVGAWARLVIILCHEVRWFDVRPQKVSADVHGAMERVLSLGPKSISAHEAMAQVHMALDGDWRAAAAEFAQAYELDPADADNARRLADINARLTGDNEGALLLYRKAIELDPVNFRNYQSLSLAYENLGRFADAEACLRKAIDLDPTVPGLHGALGFELAQLGRRTEALAEIQRETDEESRQYSLARAYWAFRHKGASDAAVATLEQRYAATAPGDIAEAHAYRGEVDQAFDWLNRAYLANPENLLDLKPDLAFKSIRGDPRYKALLRKMNLPE
jgi:adenylate cyclase